MSIKETLKKSCEAIKSSAVKIGEDIKLEHKRNTLNSELDDMYNTLGRIRYAEIIGGEHSELETQRITAEISRLTKELNYLDSISNTKCANCGKTSSKDSEFCPYCGKKLEK